jgi:hypothetical protein
LHLAAGVKVESGRIIVERRGGKAVRRGYGYYFTPIAPI